MVVVVLAVVLVPLGLAGAGLLERPGAGSATAPEPSPTDAPVDPDVELQPPDPGDHEGSDADFATLLNGVEASERVMLRFQRELAQSAGLGDPDDLAPFFAAVRVVAEAEARRLSDARADLEAPLDTDGAETVRAIYLDHLDAWLNLMRAAADDPTLFGPAGDTGRFDVAINATAVDFSRALEAELPADADDEIVRFAQDLLDRGFRFDRDAQV